MPRQAVALKKNRGAISPVSKICESEHTDAPLRHVEELRVQSCPLDKPERAGSHSGISPPVSRYTKLAPSHFSNHGSKVSPAVAGVESWDVLDEQPSESAVPSCSVNNSHCVKEKSASCCCSILILQPRSFSSYGEILAGEPANDQIDSPESGNLLFGDLGYVAQMRDLRPVVPRHSHRERLDLGDPDALPAQRLPCNAGGTDPVKKR